MARREGMREAHHLAFNTRDGATGYILEARMTAEDRQVKVRVGHRGQRTVEESLHRQRCD